MPMVRATQRRADRDDVSVSGLIGQSRAGQLQRGEGRHHRRHQGARGRAREAPDHRQLRRARADRYRHGRRARAAGRRCCRAMPMQRVGTAGGGRGGGAFPVSDGCGVHHAPGDRVNGGLMLMRRVVVTGMGGVTALGISWPRSRRVCAARGTPIRRMAEWDRFDGLEHAARRARRRLRAAGALDAQADCAAWGVSRCMAVRARRACARRRGPRRRSGDAERPHGRRLRLVRRQHVGRSRISRRC